jgi:hypothetical protein
VKLRKGDLVYLRWEDSVGCSRGWQPADEARSTTRSIIESVGWVCAVGRKAVQIAPHVGTHGGDLSCLQGCMTIPRSALLTAKILERARG